MARCLFASDLHGRSSRYAALFEAVRAERPDAVLLGGDLMPMAGQAEFLDERLFPRLEALRGDMGRAYPAVIVILGNDDLRSMESRFFDAEASGLLRYAHERRLQLGAQPLLGYACVPPTPFRLKDFERYDVSRYVDPGCVSPEDGERSVPVAEHEARFATIAKDLERLAGDLDLRDAVCLFHAPPYDTSLDRAALDGRSVEHVPLDVHIGSIAIRRFIEARQPLLTLHGHVHESTRLTGAWQERMGRTLCLQAAHDGPELCLIRFDSTEPAGAARELLPVLAEEWP